MERWKLIMLTTTATIALLVALLTYLPTTADHFAAAEDIDALEQTVESLVQMRRDQMIDDAIEWCEDRRDRYESIEDCPRWADVKRLREEE